MLKTKRCGAVCVHGGYGTRSDVIGKVFARVKKEPGLLVECIIDNTVVALFFICIFFRKGKNKQTKKRFCGAYRSLRLVCFAHPL